MIRAAVLFVQITVLVFISVWLANEPGTVTIQWRDWRIEPPIGVMVLIVLILALATALAYRVWRYLRKAPTRFLTNRRANRERKGYRELAEGMVSLAEGDAQNAMRHARRADALLGPGPAGHLLIAQAAALEGKTLLAKEHFEAMQEDGASTVAGMRGLLEQALAADDKAEALRLAEKIRMQKPDAVWVLPHLFDLQVAALDWPSADATITAAIRRHVMPSEEGKHKRALVLFQRGRAALELGDEEAALGFLREANDLDPGLARVAVEYAELLKSAGKKRRALRVLEQNWTRTHHPEAARAYVSFSASDSSVERLKAMQKLAAHEQGGTDGLLLLAEYALEARLWGEARRHLEMIFRDQPTAAAYRLMAALEIEENEDEDAAARWRAKVMQAIPDKVWTCSACNTIADRWAVNCPNCGTFDRLSWAVGPAALPAAQLPGMESIPRLQKLET